MQFLDLALRVLDDDERPTDAPAVTRDMDGLLLQVDVDADKLVDAAGAAELAERPDEARAATGQAEDVTVQVDDEMSFGVDLRAVEDVDVYAWPRGSAP